MKPVAIFRHASQVGAGFFVDYLNQRGIPWSLIAIDAGASIPVAPEAFSGLCFLGGPMSVNDPLPWIEAELALIRAAVAKGIPVIGHCLGGQLMAKSLGGRVSRNRVKEIGWSRVYASAEPEAELWLGGAREFSVYQWHGETFSLPQGAVRIMTNSLCENQAFVLGPHLAMQCHVEMTEAMIQDWNRDWCSEFECAEALPASVQPPDLQYQALGENLAAMRKISTRLYDKWIDGLASA